ncbi:unnamed protein product [Urochloa humidicola]
MGPPSLPESGSSPPQITADALSRAVAFGRSIAASIVTSSAAAPPPPPPRMSKVSLPPTLRPATASSIAGAAVASTAIAVVADPLHHRSNLMPPAAVPQGAMTTPDAPQLFMHDPCIDVVFVP